MYKRDKKEKKAKKESSRSNTPVVEQKSKDKDEKKALASSGGAASVSPSSAGDGALDLSALLKLEPHIGVIAKLEQHAKDVPNQQAYMYEYHRLS